MDAATDAKKTQRKRLTVVLLVLGWFALADLTVYQVYKARGPLVRGGVLVRHESRRPVDWDWDIYISVPGDEIEYRFHADQPFVHSTDRATVPASVARVERIAPVPVELRYKDWFGFRRERTVIFDIPRGMARQIKAYLHEGVNWVELEGASPPAPARARFAIQTDDCGTVRYSIDSDALDRTLEAERSTVEFPGAPRTITIRIDFCDGSHSETYRDGARTKADLVKFVRLEPIAPPSKDY